MVLILFFRNDSSNIQVSLDLHFNALERKIPSYRQLKDILISLPRDKEDPGLAVLGKYRFRIHSVDIFYAEMVYRQQTVPSVILDTISTPLSNGSTDSTHSFNTTKNSNIFTKTSSAKDNTVVAINIHPDEKDTMVHKGIFNLNHKTRVDVDPSTLKTNPTSVLSTTERLANAASMTKSDIMTNVQKTSVEAIATITTVYPILDEGIYSNINYLQPILPLSKLVSSKPTTVIYSRQVQINKELQPENTTTSADNRQTPDMTIGLIEPSVEMNSVTEGSGFKKDHTENLSFSTETTKSQPLYHTSLTPKIKTTLAPTKYVSILTQYLTPTSKVNEISKLRLNKVNESSTLPTVPGKIDFSYHKTGIIPKTFINPVLRPKHNRKTHLHKSTTLNDIRHAPLILDMSTRSYKGMNSYLSNNTNNTLIESRNRFITNHMKHITTELTTANIKIAHSPPMTPSTVTYVKQPENISYKNTQATLHQTSKEAILSSIVSESPYAWHQDPIKPLDAFPDQHLNGTLSSWENVRNFIFKAVNGSDKNNTMISIIKAILLSTDKNSVGQMIKQLLAMDYQQGSPSVKVTSTSVPAGNEGIVGDAENFMRVKSGGFLQQSSVTSSYATKNKLFDFGSSKGPPSSLGEIPILKPLSTTAKLLTRPVEVHMAAVSPVTIFNKTRNHTSTSAFRAFENYTHSIHFNSSQRETTTSLLPSVGGLSNTTSVTPLLHLNIKQDTTAEQYNETKATNISTDMVENQLLADTKMRQSNKTGNEILSTFEHGDLMYSATVITQLSKYLKRKDKHHTTSSYEHIDSEYDTSTLFLESTVPKDQDNLNAPSYPFEQEELIQNTTPIFQQNNTPKQREKSHSFENKDTKYEAMTLSQEGIFNITTESQSSDSNNGLMRPDNYIVTYPRLSDSLITPIYNKHTAPPPFSSSSKSENTRTDSRNIGIYNTTPHGIKDDTFHINGNDKFETETISYSVRTPAHRVHETNTEVIPAQSNFFNDITEGVSTDESLSHILVTIDETAPKHTYTSPSTTRHVPQPKHLLGVGLNILPRNNVTSFVQQPSTTANFSGVTTSKHTFAAPTTLEYVPQTKYLWNVGLNSHLRNTILSPVSLPSTTPNIIDVAAVKRTAAASTTSEYVPQIKYLRNVGLNFLLGNNVSSNPSLSSTTLNIIDGASSNHTSSDTSTTEHVPPIKTIGNMGHIFHPINMIPSTLPLPSTTLNIIDETTSEHTTTAAATTTQNVPSSKYRWDVGVSFHPRNNIPSTENVPQTKYNVDVSPFFPPRNNITSTVPLPSTTQNTIDLTASKRTAAVSTTLKYVSKTKYLWGVGFNFIPRNNIPPTAQKPSTTPGPITFDVTTQNRTTTVPTTQEYVTKTKYLLDVGLNFLPRNNMPATAQQPSTTPTTIEMTTQQRETTVPTTLEYVSPTKSILGVVLNFLPRNNIQPTAPQPSTSSINYDVTTQSRKTIVPTTSGYAPQTKYLSDVGLNFPPRNTIPLTAQQPSTIPITNDVTTQKRTTTVPTTFQHVPQTKYVWDVGLNFLSTNNIPATSQQPSTTPTTIEMTTQNRATTVPTSSEYVFPTKSILGVGLNFLSKNNIQPTARQPSTTPTTIGVTTPNRTTTVPATSEYVPQTKYLWDVGHKFLPRNNVPLTAQQPLTTTTTSDVTTQKRATNAPTASEYVPQTKYLWDVGLDFLTRNNVPLTAQQPSTTPSTSEMTTQKHATNAPTTSEYGPQTKHLWDVGHKFLPRNNITPTAQQPSTTPTTSDMTTQKHANTAPTTSEYVPQTNYLWDVGRNFFPRTNTPATSQQPSTTPTTSDVTIQKGTATVLTTSKYVPQTKYLWDVGLNFLQRNNVPLTAQQPLTTPITFDVTTKNRTATVPTTSEHVPQTNYLWDVGLNFFPKTNIPATAQQPPTIPSNISMATQKRTTTVHTTPEYVSQTKYLWDVGLSLPPRNDIPSTTKQPFTTPNTSDVTTQKRATNGPTTPEYAPRTKNFWDLGLNFPQRNKIPSTAKQPSTTPFTSGMTTQTRTTTVPTTSEYVYPAKSISNDELNLMIRNNIHTTASLRSTNLATNNMTKFKHPQTSTALTTTDFVPRSKQIWGVGLNFLQKKIKPHTPKVFNVRLPSVSNDIDTTASRSTTSVPKTTEYVPSIKYLWRVGLNSMSDLSNKGSFINQPDVRWSMNDMQNRMSSFPLTKGQGVRVSKFKA